VEGGARVIKSPRKRSWKDHPVNFRGGQRTWRLRPPRGVEGEKKEAVRTLLLNGGAGLALKKRIKDTLQSLYRTDSRRDQGPALQRECPVWKPKSQKGLSLNAVRQAGKKGSELTGPTEVTEDHGQGRREKGKPYEHTIAAKFFQGEVARGKMREGRATPVSAKKRRK